MTNIKYIEAVETIQNKLKGKDLSYKEIYNLMDEISRDRLGNILTTYFASAGFSKGYTTKELFYLTKAMVETGTKIDFPGIVADKHSVGGVAGMRTTMIIVPIVAAAGYLIPKDSSRAITSPAGTADVMEVLATVNFTPAYLKKIVEKTGGCIVWGGHLGIAPADDVIIKVEEPLAFESFDKIIVSIMAKKVAVSTNHLVIDMPIGRTMKIKYEKDALLLKKKFIEIGEKFGIKMVVDINHTTAPGGNGVGPALEAVDVLKILEQTKDRPIPLEKRAIRLAGKLLDLCYKTENKNLDGDKSAIEILKSGKALVKFKEIIQAQLGNPDVSSDQIKLGKYQKEVLSHKSGKIVGINNYNLNSLARILGAPIDKKAGIYLHKKNSDEIKHNHPLMTLYSSDKNSIEEVEETIKNIPVFDIK